MYIRTSVYIEGTQSVYMHISRQVVAVYGTALELKS